MTADRQGGDHFGGELGERTSLDPEGVPVSAFTHKRVVEGPRAARRINRRKMAGHLIRPAHGDVATAPLPQQELQQALGVE